VIIALVSKKGGVGKTTTAVNLSAAMARRGLRVLLVDLDSQGSTSLSLGFTREQFPPSAADVLLGNMSMAEAVRATSTDGLHLVTSSADLSRADQSLANFAGRERILQSKLKSVRDEYDFILLDCPPSLSLIPTAALVASDGFIIPMTPHFLALEGISNLIAAADRVCQHNATRTQLLGILLTMVDYRTKLTRDNIRRIREQYRRQVFAIEIRVNIRLAEAPGYGKTIFQYDPDAPGAQSYSLLAEELLLRLSAARSASQAASASQPELSSTPQPITVL